MKFYLNLLIKGKWTQNLIAAAALVFLSTYTSEMASILTASRLSQRSSYKGIDVPEVIVVLNYFNMLVYLSRIAYIFSF